jgi:pimeloyl-ACP methyl ester carboxylesterase
MSNFAKKLVSSILLAAFLSSSFSALAQAPRGGRVAANKAAAAPKCSGAWTGTINYTRQQRQSDNKRVERVSGRGVDTRDWQLNYNYSAQVAVLEAPEKNGSSIGRATINHSMTSDEKVEAVESNSCDRGKTWRDMRGTSTSKSAVTASQGGIEANVNIGVNSDGTYSVSVGVPQIQGQVTGSQTSSFSGQCTPKEGRNTTMPATETSVDGHSLTSDGTNRVDPSNPNKLSGSYTLNLPGGVAETITWSLQKCGAPLRITDLKFEDMKFPNWNDWQEVSEQRGTIDGNLVKIKATVLNASGETRYADLSFKETYKGDKWDGARPDMPLKDHTVSVSLGAGEQRDVEIAWDTSGYSWYDDGRPRLVQRIKAELWEQNKLVDDMTKNIKVAPKPVVLVHGIWASWLTFETWQNILTTSHSYDWKAFPVGEVTNKGIINTGRDFLSSEETNSTPQNADTLKGYIRYAQEDRNAWHVDIVAHSVGGIISRYYIQNLMPPNPEDGRPQVEHLVMVGTPNMGSPCADVMDLAFDLTGKSPRVIKEITQPAMAEFNRAVVARRGVKFSTLAGNPLPTMCKSIVPNDGFVSVPSAFWNISDRAESSSIHTDLTGTKDFSDFVKPHLAVGPRGDHNPDVQPPMGSYWSKGPRHYGVMFSGSSDMLSPVAQVVGGGGQPFARDLRVLPGQSVEIDVPVETARNFGVTFMADPKISATLIDAAGNSVGTNLANTPSARGWFRSIFYDRPTTAGTWKLHIENTGAQEYRMVVTTWKDA